MIDFDRLENKVALIGGADDGIGLARAEAFAAGGAHGHILADAIEWFREIERGFGALEAGSSQ